MLLVLKNTWERNEALVQLDKAKASSLLAPHTQDSIAEIDLMTTGCANSNYKILFEKDRSPLLLRIYSRDRFALQREVAIHCLVESTLPVAKHLFFDPDPINFSHPYSIMEWIDGETFRDVIFKNNETAIRDCLFEAGQYLDNLRQITFPQGGFFESNLHIRPFSEDEKFLPYIMHLLQDQTIKTNLVNNLHRDIQQFIEDNASLLLNLNTSNLTHGDYDPSNMLVKQIDGKWKITAILDWEFAFAGTYLFDLGLMLRYSHRLPHYYEETFLAGLTATDLKLPDNWKKQAKLFDLLCLLQMLVADPGNVRPKANRDIVSLIEDICYSKY